MPHAFIDQIVRSKRRTVALHITPDARLIIRAPEKASLEAINRLVSEKLPWINRKQAAAKELAAQRVQKQFVTGEEFLYLGQRYKLCIESNAPAPLAFTGERFVLACQYQPQAQRQFVAWYKQRALEVLQQRVAYYADQAGLKYRSVKITSAKRQWGSCNFRGALNFSWRVILAPIMGVDYVVAHELAHLTDPNHSKRFWSKVSALYPQYQQARGWLRRNCHLLEL